MRTFRKDDEKEEVKTDENQVETPSTEQGGDTAAAQPAEGQE